MVSAEGIESALKRTFNKIQSNGRPNVIWALVLTWVGMADEYEVWLDQVVEARTS